MHSPGICWNLQIGAIWWILEDVPGVNFNLCDPPPLKKNHHNDIIVSIDKGEVSALTQLDLSATFDTIDHAILTNRLTYWYGLSGRPQIWFSSYWKNWQQSKKSHSHMGFPRAPYHDHCFLPYTLQTPAL